MEVTKEVFRVTLAGFDIILEQHEEGSLRVTYGKQKSHWMDYAAATQELGCCIMHALALDGKLIDVEE